MNIDVRLSCYGTIMRVMNAETFSQNQAARIVGGKMRLEHLIRAGKVRAIKANDTAQNGRWRINAADVLRNARAVDRCERMSVL